MWQGLIDDSRRGVWSLTPLGWRTKLDEQAASTLYKQTLVSIRGESAHTPIDPTPSATDTIPLDLPLEDLQEHRLLQVPKGLPPYGFELLCERLLREHGFEEVQVTRKSRDGGIDG